MSLWDDCGRGRGDLGARPVCVARDYPGQRLVDYLGLRGGQLGDLVCSPAEATAARLAVEELNRVNEAAGSPAAFAPYVDAINKDWQAFDDAVIFYTWCQAKEIGQRAKALTAQIAQASGGKVAPPPSDPRLDPGPVGALNNLVATLGKLVVPAVVIVGALTLAPAVGRLVGEKK